MRVCGIYKITSPSKKVYIGQSVDIFDRWSSYKNLHCVAQKRLYNSLVKHGVGKHKFEVICQCDRAELNNLEIYYIELYQCFCSEHGLNLRKGGGEGEISSEHKQKIKQALIGHTISQETRDKISKTLKDKKYPITTHRANRIKASNSVLIV